MIDRLIDSAPDTEPRGNKAVGMDHDITITALGEGQTQAVCSCGWRSERFGAEKDTGTMDALQQARDAGDLHQWDQTLPE